MNKNLLYKTLDMANRYFPNFPNLDTRHTCKLHDSTCDGLIFIGPPCIEPEF